MRFTNKFYFRQWIIWCGLSSKALRYKWNCCHQESFARQEV